MTNETPQLEGALAIFILRPFFIRIPQGLFDAARVDGAGEFRGFWHIPIPMAKPVLGTIAILNVLGTWNDFVWRNITISDSTK